MALYYPPLSLTRVTSDEMNSSPSHATTKAVLTRLANNEIPLMEYLEEDPLEMLKLMYVCRDTRKAAARKLRQLEYKPSTKWKQDCFHQWLDSPNFLGSNDPFPLLYEGMEGPLRLEAIRATDWYFKERFVILKYERDFTKEDCLLTIFDDDGRLFKVYEFACEIDGSLCDSDMHDLELRNASVYWKCSRFGLKTSEDYPTFNFGHNTFLRYAERVGNGIDDAFTFAESYFNYIDHVDMNGVLSPIEVMCILWHALSFDRDIIRVYLSSFKEEFDWDLEEELRINGRDGFILPNPHRGDLANQHSHYNLQRVREKIELLENAFQADGVEWRVEQHLDGLRRRSASEE